jgi:hypothetical protein
MNIRILLLSILLLSMATLVMAQATDLFISEYVEGTSNQKAIEIFNGTGAAVDLSQYSLKKQTNGAGAFGNELALTGTLNNLGCFVIVVSSTTGTTLESQPYVDLATTSFAMAYNGNDCVALCKNSNPIDVVGILDQITPNWGTDLTFRRLATVVSPRAIWDINEWTQLAVNTFDDLGVHTFNPTTNPFISVVSPNGGEQWHLGSIYQIMWSHANFTSPVKIELLNGATPTTLIESAENSGVYSWEIPTTMTLGTNYKVQITAVGVTPVVSDISDNPFSLIEAIPTIDVATIAELRSHNGDITSIFHYTGTAYITYFRDTRHQKYIQDETGAVLIDDPNGVITSQFALWDGITNLRGTLTAYHTQIEYVPIVNPGEAVGTHVIEPQMVSIADLTANFSNYDAELVRLNNVTFLPDTTEGIFVVSTSYNITDLSGGSMVFRTNFSEADYIGQSIPTTPRHVDGIAIPFDATLQIASRTSSDIGPVGNNDPVVNVTTPVLYGNVPNPFNGSTSIRFDAKSNNPVTINVYNVKGQKVATIVNNERSAGYQNVSWDGKDSDGNKLPSGVYLYKMLSGSYSSTKKMILMK